MESDLSLKSNLKKKVNLTTLSKQISGNSPVYLKPINKNRKLDPIINKSVDLNMQVLDFKFYSDLKHANKKTHFQRNDAYTQLKNNDHHQAVLENCEKNQNKFESINFFRPESCAPSKIVRFATNLREVHNCKSKSINPSPIIFYNEKNLEWEKLAQTIKNKAFFQYPISIKKQRKTFKMSIKDILS